LPLPGATGFPAPNRVAMRRAGANDNTATNASSPAEKEKEHPAAPANNDGVPGPLYERENRGATEATSPGGPCSVYHRSVIRCLSANYQSCHEQPQSLYLAILQNEAVRGRGPPLAGKPRLIRWGRLVPKTSQLPKRPTVGACECPSIALRTKYRACVHLFWQAR
jgi:hypothetical protein